MHTYYSYTNDITNQQLNVLPCNISPWARYQSPAPPPPTTLQEWYNFVQGNDTNQNRGVPNDLIGMHYAIWAIFKMAFFEKDENNKRSIYDCY